MQVDFHRLAYKEYQGLDNNLRAAVVHIVRRLKEHSTILPRQFTKKVAPHIFELRIHDLQAVRILYSIQGNRAYILSLFIKKTQKLPARQLKKANNRLKNVLTIL